MAIIRGQIPLERPKVIPLKSGASNKVVFQNSARQNTTQPLKILKPTVRLPKNIVPEAEVTKIVSSMVSSSQLQGPQVIGARIRFLGLLMTICVGALAINYVRLEWKLAVGTAPVSNNLRGKIQLRDGTVMAESFEPQNGDTTISDAEFQRGQVRRYPQGSLAGQVLGFEGRDKGLEGLEFFSQKSLASGKNLTLTLDSVIQATMEARIEEAVLEQHADAASAVAIETATGRVLGVANYPRFNPGRRQQYDDTQWSNRAFRNQFEPGSTIKALVAAMLINEGAARPETLVEAPMRRVVSGHTINDAIHHKSSLTLQQVLRYSSNVGISKMTERGVSKKTLWTYLRDYGFGQPITLQGASPTSGSLHDWQDWRPIDHATATFGQGISTTTLQLTTAFSVLANDGLLITPSLIEGGLPTTRRVISVEAARQTRAMLKNVVQEGLPHTAVIPGYCIGGKTGTAQTAINGKYSAHVFGALFAGFFPCENPRITMVVEVYNPKKEIHGSLVAAPAFRKIAEEILAHWGVAPTPEKN